MRRLQIHQKLSLIVAFLTLPILAFAALAVRDGLDEASRIDRALLGVEAIDALSDLSLQAATRGAWENATPPAAADRLLSEDDRAAARKTLTDAMEKSPSQRVAVAGREIGRVARASALSASTPGDDYVLTTLSSQSVPLILRRIRVLADVGVRLAAKDTLSGADRMAFLVNAGQYKGVADQMSSLTRETLGDGAAEGASPTAVAAAAFRKANSAVQKNAAALANAINGGSSGAALPLAPFEAAVVDFIAASDALNRAALGSMREKLDANSAAAWTNIIVAGAAGAAVLIIALCVAAAMRRSILTAIAALSNGVKDLADHDIAGAIPCAEGRDEISEIARAVAYFRDRTVEQTSEALNARRAAEDEDRAQTMAALERAFGDVVSAAIDGDLTRRVPATFEDAALNRLAEQVNDLVAAFEHGLQETSDVMARLARADLGARMERQTRGAFLDLQSDINTFVDALSDIVGRLRSASSDLKKSGGAITENSEALGRRMAEQRSAASETSKTISDMVASVLDCASKAKATRETVDGARRAAAEGRTAMTAADADMERIRAAADKISKIIDMIEEIAMNTSMLATNASVEASRAGHAGKSFAVVADEVRALAQSTSSASDDVKRLVTTTLAEIESGASRVRAATETLAAVDAAIVDSATSMAVIADTNTRQAADLETLSDVAKRMDASADDCSRQLGQTQSEIKRTEAQTEVLDAVVAGFTTAEDSPQSRAA